MALDSVIQQILRELAGPVWLAKRVEILPGVVDSEIIYVTPEMERLYGYVWPDTLVGRRISEIHTLADTNVARQYALLRHVGGKAPCDYVMHGTHPSGRIFRVIKHVDQQTVGPHTLWVTHHEPWRPSTPYPLLKPLRERYDPPDVLEPFLGHANAAEMHLLLQAALARHDPLILPQSLQRDPSSESQESLLFTYSKLSPAPTQGPNDQRTGMTEPPLCEALPEFQCQKCRHCWRPRKPTRPEVCPRCKNPRWWEARQRQRQKKTADARRPPVENA